MKRVLFLITIDTEIDKSPNWRVSLNESFSSIIDGIPNILTPLFEQFHAKPTYLLSPEVLECGDCIKVLKNIRECELGTHLHEEFVEPYRKLYLGKSAGRRTDGLQTTYSPDTERAKITHLTKLFVDAFGYKPKSFRAGRFAARPHTIKCLQDLGYLVDTSVTPNIKWKFEGKIIDYSDAPIQPYFPDKNKITKSARASQASSVLEVPVTIIPCNPEILFDKIRLLRRKIRWLRPSFENLKTMINVCNKVIENVSRDIITLNMMFHSVEIIPNASPYVKSVRDALGFLRRLEGVLRYAVNRGWEFATLAEAYQCYKDNLNEVKERSEA